MFLFSAKAFLAEMERLEPAMLGFCRDALLHAHRDLDFIRLGEVAFLACPSQSIDYAVMEHAANAAVVPVEMGWNDVGSWQSLWDIAPRDADGNAILGEVVTAKNPATPISAAKARWWRRWEWKIWWWWPPRMRCWSATATPPRMSRRSSSSWKPRAATSTSIMRWCTGPGGRYESVDTGDALPGQAHHRQARRQALACRCITTAPSTGSWSSGTALVTCGDKQFLLRRIKSTYIPLGARHRLENPGKVPLHLIEVQSGGYLGEDDIVRFEDTYGRAPQATKPV